MRRPPGQASFSALWAKVLTAPASPVNPTRTRAATGDKAAAVLRLMESLEEDDDVQQVYANFDIPIEVLERVSAQV
jgi:transcriptional/translational regulatory protein YebC/TACO1